MGKDKSIKELIIEGKLPYTTPCECECGADLMANSNLTQIYCSNSACIVHGSQKFKEMLEILNIKVGIGDQISEDVINYLGIDTPIEIFNINFDEVDIPTRYYSAVTGLFREVNRIKEEGIELYKFITILFLPLLGRTRSKVIFSPYSDIEEFYEKYDTEEKLKRYLEKVLEISIYTNTIIDIYNVLIENKDMIIERSKWFKFKQSYGDTFYITLTGSILHVKDDNGNLFSPRDEFAKYVSEKVGVNVQVIGFNESKTNVLIMDNDMRSNNKYKKATRAGIAVLRSDEFLEKMIEMYGEKSNGEDEGNYDVDSINDVEISTSNSGGENEVDDIFKWV